MPENVMQAINDLLPSILSIILMIAVYYIQSLITTWRPRIEAYIDAHVNARTQEIIRVLGQEAYAYAQTVYKKDNGADKLKAALSFFHSNMSKYGLTSLTPDVIRAAIEKAYLDAGSCPTEPIISSVPAAVETPEEAYISVTQLINIANGIAEKKIPAGEVGID